MKVFSESSSRLQTANTWSWCQPYNIKVSFVFVYDEFEIMQTNADVFFIEYFNLIVSVYLRQDTAIRILKQSITYSLLLYWWHY